jgi:hypothetical protein
MHRSPRWRSRALCLITLGALLACEEDRVLRADRQPDMLISDAPLSDLAPPPDAASPITEDAAPPPPEDAAPPPVVPPPQVPTRVEVKLGSPVTEAGVENRVTCQVYDQSGAPLLDDVDLGEVRVDVRPQDGWAREEETPNLVTGLVANPYEVRCALPAWGLRSGSADWLVVPAAPASAVAIVEPERAVAGREVDLRCVTHDAYGNLVPAPADAITWRLSPADEGVTLNGSTLTVTRAGEYEVSCALEGVSDPLPAPLMVVPDLPARVEVDLRGGQRTFFLGDLVEVEVAVFDQYQNLVEGAPVSYTLNPNRLEPFGTGHYIASSAGSYSVTVSALPPVQAGGQVAASVSFSVDDGAPSISCTSPSMGAMRDMSPLSLTGRVADSSGVSEVSVDGRSVQLDASGAFSVPLTPAWGLNMHEVSARDSLGQVNSTLCANFAAPTYLSESSPISDVALLHLSQSAIDDGAPRAPISSLGDLFGSVLSSSQLISTVSGALRAQNPIVPNACRLSTPFGCAFSGGAEFTSLSVGGPNPIALTLITNGVNIDARLQNIRVNLRAFGSFLGGTLNQTGYVSVSSIRVNGNLSVGLSGSSPSLQVSGTPSVTVGALTLELTINIPVVGTVVNAFVNLIFDLFESTVRGLISTQIKNFITNEVDTLLTSTLSGLNLGAIAFNLDIPNPFGGGPVRLNLSFGLNRLEANSSRLRVGLQGTLSGSSAHARTSSGVAAPSGARLVELTPGTGRDVAGAAHVTLLNASLHRLWRAGLFDVQSGAIAGLPAGASLSLQTLVPPAVELITPGVSAKLHFGPARAQIAYPGLIERPISVYVGAYATSSVSLSAGNALTFGAITVQGLKLGADGVTLSPQARAALQGTLTEVLQDVFDTALNGALPSFPIPEFAIPSAFSQYGVPRNLVLGARALVLERSGGHLIVKGDFRQ